jgi:KaiC/GvpD/RAD55 family RecA-like ATPase
MVTQFNVEGFVLDGVIILRKATIGDNIHRILSVEKMRGTKHDTNIHKFEITEKGIVVR